MPGPAPNGRNQVEDTPLRHHRVPDAAGAGSIQLLGVLLAITVFAIPLITTMIGPQDPTGGYAIAEQRVHQGLDDLFESAETLCCPEDPSSPNHFHNLLMATIAGDENARQDLEGFALPFFPAPDTTEIKLDLGFAPQGDPGATTMLGGLHTIPVLETREPTGQTTGKPHLLPLPEFGPAHVIPRLENVTGQATIDIDYIPLDPTLPYRTTPTRLERTTIQTEIEHTRTAITSDFELTLVQTNHAQVMGGWSPHMDLHWAEPDWLSLEENPREPDDTKHTITYTLSSAELAAERTIHQELNPDEVLPEGIYPQHRFQLNVNLTGPGEVARAPVGLDADDEYEVSHAYRLEVDIPRGWTNVEVNDDDEDDNKDNNWDPNKTFVFPQEGGSHRIIALLNATELSYRDNITTPQGNTTRYLLNAERTLQAPFHFHAQPPDTASNTDLGFQHIQARLTNTAWTIEQRTTMTLELANNPGRIHRTLTTTTPQLIPNTPQIPTGTTTHPHLTPTPTTSGIPITLAAILENGAEPATVKKITWTAPPDTFLPRDPNPTTDAIPDPVWSTWTDILSDDEDTWTRSPDGSTITWTPSTPQPCLALEACGIAATVYADGRNLTASDHPPNPETTILYHDHNLDDYVHWYVRTNNAHTHHHDPSTQGPPFTRATHHLAGAAHGPHTGTYVIRLPPTTTPICHADQLEHRSQPDHQGAGGRDAPGQGDGDPREDGYPYLAFSNNCLDPKGEVADHRFPLVIATGNNTPGGPAIRSIGKATYATSTQPGQDPTETHTAWQNGLKEARPTGPSQVEPGETAVFTVHMEALADELSRNGVEEATVRYALYDPYNAWEDRAWAKGVLVRQGAVWLPDPTQCVTPDCREELESWDCFPDGCEEPDTCLAPEGFRCDGAFPSFMTFELEVPDRVVLGTHVLVLEVAWGTDRGGGYQTGRVVVPFDVVLPGGEQGRASLVGGVAWSEDWG